jgi:hypothetical protein
MYIGNESFEAVEAIFGDRKQTKSFYVEISLSQVTHSDASQRHPGKCFRDAGKRDGSQKNPSIPLLSQCRTRQYE